jgi:hypothetical protein
MGTLKLFEQCLKNDGKMILNKVAIGQIMGIYWTTGATIGV